MALGTTLTLATAACLRGILAETPTQWREWRQKRGLVQGHTFWTDPRLDSVEAIAQWTFWLWIAATVIPAAVIVVIFFGDGQGWW